MLRQFEQHPEGGMMMKTNQKEESLWLKVFCPESMCFRAEERIDLSTAGKPESEGHAVGSEGLFDEIFCPEDFCQVYQYTDLP